MLESWIIGVILNIIGSISINCGTNLMKFGHDEDKRELLKVEEEEENLSPRDDDTLSSVNESMEDNVKKSKVWYVGIWLFVTGSVINFVSYAFAGQSLLASLGTVQFVSNVFFGKFILGEEVRSID